MINSNHSGTPHRLSKLITALHNWLGRRLSLATLITPDARVQKPVHAGNCHTVLSDALQAAASAIEEATDLLHYHDDQDVVFESSNTEKAFLALTAVMVEIENVIALCGPEENALSEIGGGAHV